jgi:hypothetical protein
MSFIRVLKVGSLVICNSNLGYLNQLYCRSRINDLRQRINNNTKLVILNIFKQMVSSTKESTQKQQLKEFTFLTSGDRFAFYEMD